jgi:Fe-S cluster biogenesis protein NfuA
MTDNLTQQQFGRIEELTVKLDKTADPAARATAKELVQLLMEVHGAGLERMMQLASEAGPAGAEIIDRLGRDELTRNLLLLYGLHPVDLDTRVAEALEKVRPYLRSRGADVELIGIAAGTASVRLNGNAHGCTAATLTSAVEEALYTEAPDLVSVSVETTPVSTSVFLPLGELRMLNAAGS